MEKIYLFDSVKRDFLYFNFFIRQKGCVYLFLWPSFSCQLLIHPCLAQLFLLFFWYQRIVYFKAKKSKIRSPFLFQNFGRIKSSFVKVIVICFSSYSCKYSTENRSWPVMVLDKTFPMNFSFHNMFVFDLLCISSKTKNLVPLTGEILILFSSSFIITANFSCSVVSLLYVLMSV